MLDHSRARAAREALLGANPEVRIDAICERLTPANVQRLVAAVDVVVDAADSFAVTYAVSDECQRVKKPLISASVLGSVGIRRRFLWRCSQLPGGVPGDAAAGGVMCYGRRTGHRCRRHGCA